MSTSVVHPDIMPPQCGHLYLHMLFRGGWALADFSGTPYLSDQFFFLVSAGKISEIYGRYLPTPAESPRSSPVYTNDSQPTNNETILTPIEWNCSCIIAFACLQQRIIGSFIVYYIQCIRYNCSMWMNWLVRAALFFNTVHEEDRYMKRTGTKIF